MAKVKSRLRASPGLVLPPAMPGTLSFNPLAPPITGPPVSAPPPRPLHPEHSIRAAHVLKLHDLINHLVSLPPSYDNSRRTLRAWRCLAKCKEIDIGALWALGGRIVERVWDGPEDVEEDKARKARWLVGAQENRLAKLEKMTEYVLSLVAAGRARQALEEMDTCVSFAFLVLGRRGEEEG